METVKNVISHRINDLLTKSNKKQKELAEYLNVTANTISYYATGARTPNIEQIIKIAAFFETTTDYILGVSDVKTTDHTLKTVCEYTSLDENAIYILHTHVKDYPLRRNLINFLFTKDSYNFMSKLITYIAYRTTEELIADDEIYRYAPLKYSFTDSRIAFADIIEVLPRLKSNFKKMIEETPDKKNELCLEYLSKTINNSEIIKIVNELYGIYSDENSLIYEPNIPETDLEEDEQQRKDEMLKDMMEKEKAMEEYQNYQECIEVIYDRLTKYLKSKNNKKDSNSEE